MPKLWLCLLVSVFAARAGVITSTPVNCDGRQGIGSCNTVLATAEASVSPSFTSALATDDFSNPGPNGMGGFATATAQLQGDLDLTVTAGPAMGFFEPCIALNTSNSPGGSSSSASGTFGSFSASGSSGTTCGAPVSFNLGMPQDFQAALLANASALGQPLPFFSAESSADAMLSFQFFDASMNPVQATSILTPGPGPSPAPEPSTVFPLLGGLAFLVLSLARHKRLNLI